MVISNTGKAFLRSRGCNLWLFTSTLRGALFSFAFHRARNLQCSSQAGCNLVYWLTTELVGTSGSDVLREIISGHFTSFESADAEFTKSVIWRKAHTQVTLLIDSRDQGRPWQRQATEDTWLCTYRSQQGGELCLQISCIP